ncbi:MAG: glycoside hydrolase family 28 protein [Ruminococcaceae bacterium]|nr:glycoside hydrolase family 28 protein [Oscillospiraceae bacterium]
MKYFYPENYGAAADGKTDDCKAIQLCIDDAAISGGTVVLESGKTYYSGSVTLKANVELHLQKGSVLKAASDIDSYFRPCNFINDETNTLIGNPVTGKPSFCFIYGYGADGCSITGEGTIDANGHSFVERKDRYYVTGNFYPRPTVIYIENSKHISFKDFTVTDAPFWTLHPAGCYDVLISKIRILNDLDVANSDGIDPDHCSNVRIEGCHIECADDCICLKTSKGNAEYGPCENIIITGCTLISTSAAIKIGTEGVGDFRNITVDNCIISRSNRGLSIQIRDGGNVENVSYSNIIIETRRFCPDWWGTAEPIVITSFNRDENTKSGHIRNIRFFNIDCNGENGVLIHGNKDNIIEEITFENVSVTLSKQSKWETGLYDLRPCLDYGVEKYKNSGFFIRYAKNLVIAKSCVKWGKVCDDYGFAIDARNAENVELIRFNGTAADGSDGIKIG